MGAVVNEGGRLNASAHAAIVHGRSLTPTAPYARFSFTETIWFKQT